MLIEQAKARLANAAGVYTSDVKGHLLILHLYPVRVSCVSCSETIDRSQFKSIQEFRVGADAFMGKHGALDRKIASSDLRVAGIHLRTMAQFTVGA